jgi:hypothetical protein
VTISNEKKLDEQHRLLAMREYLRVHATPVDKSFEAEVVAACVKKVQPTIDAHNQHTGEIIVGAIARDLGVRFEEVKNATDIEQLTQKYLVEKKELGFGLLAQELADPSVDALLFQRVNASGEAPDRWVAVINLQATEARAYWSRPHEIVHRLAEPPQRRLPFFRHRSDHENRVERIIDLGAAELAFPRSVFGRIVKGVAHLELTWDLVRAVRKKFAPTASLQSAAKACLHYWPHPAFLLTAQLRGRVQRPREAVALRINIDGFSPGVEKSGVHFYPNMRVPQSSPLFATHQLVQQITDYEDLGKWTTSGGSALPDRRALTSGMHVGSVVYGLISLM